MSKRKKRRLKNKMIKVPRFTLKGTKTTDLILPKEFDQKVNLNLLAQAIYVYEERSHVGFRNTTTRSEVNRTTKKVYRQKGTGGARHGSRRANLFVGGGVIFGPRPEKRTLKLSDKMKSRAKLLAYSLKAKDGQLIAVDGLAKAQKTKAIAELMKAVSKVKGAKKFTFVLSEGFGNALKSFRNLKLANTVYWKESNAYDIYKGGLIVLDTDIFAKKTETKTKSKIVKKETKGKVKTK